jgi:NADP-dependent 3-hydroxy acid dehydrogenase YdfG
MTLKPLNEQVLVITGASSGIGLVTARMAAKEGARVVVAARNEDALRQLADEIKQQGGQAAYVVADVGIEEEVNRIAEVAISTFGGFDTWINNAGISIVGLIEAVEIPDMKRLFDTNFWGAVYGMRAAVRHYKERGTASAIINTGSFFGDRSTPLQAVYASSKHALHGFTDGLRMELEVEKAPISITLIHPGRIDTPYNEHARSYIANQPAHRGMIYPPESVAEAILFAATNPRRDMFVGAQAKLFAMISGIAPRLVDKVMDVWMFPSQQSDRPSRSREDNALYKAGFGLHERGNHEGWVRSTSYYVKVVKHPLLTSVVVASLGVALGALLFSRQSR